MRCSPKESPDATWKSPGDTDRPISILAPLNARLRHVHVLLQTSIPTPINLSCLFRGVRIPGGSRAAHDYIPDPPVPPGENAATAEDSVLTRANFGAHGIRSRFELDAFLNTRGTLGAGGGSTSIEESEEQAPPSDPKVVAHEHGVMTVLLVRGRGLRGGDGRGHSNSYVKLIVGSKFQRSKTKFRTLNPEWDSYFRFDGVLGTLAHSGLRLEVYDHEPVSGRHDSLGSATVALDGLEYRKPLLLYAPLSVQGDLQVRINWTPERQKEVALNCQEMAEQLGRTAAITHAAYYACRDLGRVAKMLGQNAHVALVSWGRFLGNPVATTIPVAPVYTQEYYVVAWNGPSIGEPSTDTTQAREVSRGPELQLRQSSSHSLPRCPHSTH